MNTPDLLRAGGWRQGHIEDVAYWEHAERHGLVRWATEAALADELAHVSRERDGLQVQFEQALALLREAAPALLDGAKELRKAVSRARQAEPSWLTKDFHTLYRVARQLLRAIDGHWLDELAEAARAELSGQLTRLQPAFEETEATRAELARGKEQTNV